MLLLGVESPATSVNIQPDIYNHVQWVWSLPSSLMLSKYSSDNETQASKDSKNIIPYNVLCINSFRQANPTSYSGHHNS